MRTSSILVLCLLSLTVAQATPPDAAVQRVYPDPAGDVEWLEDDASHPVAGHGHIDVLSIESSEDGADVVLRMELREEPRLSGMDYHWAEEELVVDRTYDHVYRFMVNTDSDMQWDDTFQVVGDGGGWRVEPTSREADYSTATLHMDGQRIEVRFPSDVLEEKCTFDVNAYTHEEQHWRANGTLLVYEDSQQANRAPDRQDRSEEPPHCGSGEGILPLPAL